VESAISVTPAQLPDVLLNVAVVRPVFIWGAPGIGKSSLVRAFADSLGLPCVTLVGTQLAPEDLIGVPELRDGRSRFAPPESIARDEPYCLFLDELNSSAPEVQKAFYSLILDRRIGAYELPEGSIVIGAGNRASDNALARPMASALVNRLIHVHLRASAADWLAWAAGAGIHLWILDHLTLRPDHLWARPPKTEEPFSTPRSWHMLSDALHSYGQETGEDTLRVLTAGTLSTPHAQAFTAYVKTLRHRYDLAAVLRGDAAWPSRPEDRDLLYYLAETLRARLVHDLPADKDKAPAKMRVFAHRAKALLIELAQISLECAQLVIATDEHGVPVLPAWFMVDIGRDLPRLVAARG
jgi:hypothetical protein